MNKIILSTSLSYYIVHIEDIIYCKSSNSTTTFYLNDGSEIIVSTSIKEYEIMLKNYLFFRTHQSYLVNINCVKQIDKTKSFSITLSDGSLIPVSTRKRKELMQLLYNVLQIQIIG